jgi:hypothetical protein
LFTLESREFSERIHIYGVGVYRLIVLGKRSSAYTCLCFWYSSEGLWRRKDAFVSIRGVVARSVRTARQARPPTRLARVGGRENSACVIWLLSTGGSYFFIISSVPACQPLLIPTNYQTHTIAARPLFVYFILLPPSSSCLQPAGTEEEEGRSRPGARCCRLQQLTDADVLESDHHTVRAAEQGGLAAALHRLLTYRDLHGIGKDDDALKHLNPSTNA